MVDEIKRSRPEYLDRSFTVAEIYQDLIPYRTHRDAIGVAMNGDYEDALLRLLGGEGGYLILESDPARRQIEKELTSKNPNTALFQQFAAADVRLNPAAIYDAEPELQLDLGDDDADAPPLEEAEEPAAMAPTSSEEEIEDTPDEPAAVEEVPVHAGVTDTGARLWAMEEPVEGFLGAPDSPEEARDLSPDRCTWCAEVLPDRPGMMFCPHCGGDVHLVPCGACGEPLDPTWRFCVACGTEATSV